jgi:hypothetical protein
MNRARARYDGFNSKPGMPIFKGWPWGGWGRPKAGDPMEQLLIDRCSAPAAAGN